MQQWKLSRGSLPILAMESSLAGHFMVASSRASQGADQGLSVADLLEKYTN
jgi:hypothetical protein